MFCLLVIIQLQLLNINVSLFILQAPCEAEAQCAAMVKAGKVYATATEDMDALTFGSPVLLRHMTFSEARKMPIQEFQLDSVLETMEMSRDEVILVKNNFFYC